MCVCVCVLPADIRPSLPTEISRVLQPGGVFIVVSYGQTQHRLPYLEKSKFNWSVETLTLPKPTAPGVTHDDPEAPANHFVYVMTKNQ